MVKSRDFKIIDKNNLNKRNQKKESDIWRQKLQESQNSEKESSVVGDPTKAAEEPEEKKEDKKIEKKSKKKKNVITIPVDGRRPGEDY